MAMLSPMSKADDELAWASAVFAKRFSSCTGAVPYYPYAGRILVPPDWRPALVVPLDGDYVIETPAVNRPTPWMVESFAADLPRFIKAVESVKPHLEFSDLPIADDGIRPFFHNGYFGPMDAASLTAMLAMMRPHTYIEIGSGISTRFARRAVSRFSLTTSITCIDPAPRSSIEGIADKIIRRSLLDVDLAFFDILHEGDILFFDGSHLSFSGTDCPRFFLDILPRLAPGVLIHVHDIVLPNDYPEGARPRFYNEQQLLAAFLYENNRFQVTLPVNYMHTLGHCPEGVSFWMRRV